MAAQLEIAPSQFKSWLTVGSLLHTPETVTMKLMIPSDATYSLLHILIGRLTKLTAPSKIAYVMKTTSTVWRPGSWILIMTSG
jgi:hypothetical protein